MKLDLEYQVIPDQPLVDSSEGGKGFIAIPAAGPRPAFVETFQQIVDGLPEQIALVDEDWTILITNPAWVQTASLYGYDALVPGTNYLRFVEAKAIEGHAPAGITADGIRDMERSGETSFRFTYHGRDKWAGHAFQLCVNRLCVDGQSFATITRYDVTELVHLRQVRADFSHVLIERQAEERRRVAREVHDSTMQLLAGLGLSLGQLKRSKRAKVTVDVVREMEDLLGEAQRELRAISFLAHPPMLSELGLQQALRQLAGGFARRTGLTIATHADDNLALRPASEVAIYRMVQEALSNIHRHSHATDVVIGLHQRRSMLHIAIADNGIGMPEKVRTGVGLSSMRERIEEIGGRMMVRHGNPGTIIIASVPAHVEPDIFEDFAKAS